MEDLSSKARKPRTAMAQAVVKMNPKTIMAIKLGEIAKGNPLDAARIAAIEASRNSGQAGLDDFQITLEYTHVTFRLAKDSITVIAEVSAVYKNNVEIEAMTAAGAGALAIYDRLKNIDREIEITNHILLKVNGTKVDPLAVNFDE